MVTAARLIGILFLGALPGMSALAADIPVESGADSLARAVAQAAPGDRLLLGDGDYPGSVSLTRRIEIVGSGRSVVRLVATKGTPDSWGSNILDQVAGVDAG